MKKTNNFFVYVKDFIELYRMNLKSENTIETYREGLNSLREYLSDVKKLKIDEMTFDIITIDLIREYLKWLTDRGKSLSTRNLRLTAIKQYLKYCSTKDIEIVALYQETIKIKTKNVKPKKHNWISKEQIMLILNQTPRNRTGIRDRFIMFFIFSTGVRLSELLNLKLKDIQIEGDYPYVRVLGKGNKKRLIPVTEEFVDNYKYYLSLYHPLSNTEDYVFYTKIKGTVDRMSDDNAQRIISKYSDMARKTDKTIPKMHPHILRHSYGALMYRNGLSLPEIAKLLGHEQLSTTEIYAETDIDMIRKAMDRIGNNDIDKNWNKLSEEERLKVLGLKK